MKKLSLFLLLVLIIPIPHQARGQIYIWVDQNGVKHYGNDPPPAGAEVIGEKREIPYDAAKDRARQEADEKYWEDVAQMNRENEAASDETAPPPEEQPDLEGGSDIVHGGAPAREAIENRGERGTYEDMQAPRGSYASEEGKPGTYDDMGLPRAGGANREAEVVRHGRAQ